MTKLVKIIYQSLIVAFIIAIIFFLKYITTTNSESVLLSFLRSIFYLVMFVAWGITLYWRIINRKVRKYLISISGFMVFWIIVRIIKWNFAYTVAFERYLWYAFYIPMLMLPQLFLLIAISLGKSEAYRFPKWPKILFGPTILMIALVLTNDLHRLVFSFPESSTNWSNSDYNYNILYWFVIGWEILLYVGASSIMMVKCRIPTKKKVVVLPFIPLLCALAYCIFYVMVPSYKHSIFSDITVTMCIFVLSSIEFCIQCGLIQSNTNYGKLFRISSLKCQIADRDLNIKVATKESANVTSNDISKALVKPVMLDKSMRLKAAPIKNGYVLWQEDVSKLIETMSELEDINEYLQARRGVLQREYETSHEHHRLEEKNRLYNKMLDQTESYINLYVSLIEQLEEENDHEKEKQLTAQIILVSAYIKRRNNLIFIAENDDTVPASELGYCLNESLNGLELCGVKCGWSCDAVENFPFNDIAYLYDKFQVILMNAYGTIESMFVSVSYESDSTLVMQINIVCGADLSFASDLGTIVTYQDNEWEISCSAKGGGNIK